MFFYIFFLLLSSYYSVKYNETIISPNYYSNVIYFPSIGIQIENTTYITINSITILNKGNYLILFEGIVYTIGQNLEYVYLLCQISYSIKDVIDQSNRQILPASNSVSQISTSAIITVDKVPQIITAECAASHIPSRWYNIGTNSLRILRL